ncbi:zinc finger protein basonuclin-1 [Colossoma macropomum]|uniref:zinc finger protein basonuclin-1 n=1 Tax=Colossoma macropomum TaxID=42526 RepID=UPI001863FD33|nr:zinc finger protein basonuclin-1 [Colossoma macropomum]
MSQAICCTMVNCSCDSFSPGKLRRRQCENCRHGWVAHALSKLKVHHMYQGSQVEIVHSNVVFDICSLMLYGTQAIPVRLKILLDRLFSVLKQDEVIQILSALDWTLQDYIRGYVLQDVAGKVLDRWAIMTFEEEIATLQQFLRFGETKSIVELMALQDKEGQAVIVPTARANSDIRSFIESSMQRPTAPPPKSEPLSRSNGHHFESLVNSMAFMLPLQLLNSAPAPLLSSRADSSLQEAPVRHETLELSPDNSTHFISDPEREEVHLERASTKVESDDFTISDNYSSPSTPCTPSISSDITQMSPESKIRPGEKSTVMKKGRVICSACEKTFYDKGTLKIHYNAVHLKIKHKCTIEGCNMVFSSLRSRNRHSANPNPRLHMPMNRNNRDKDLRGGLSEGEASSPQAEKREFGAATSSADSTRSVSGYISSEPKLHSSFPSVSHSGILFPNLKTVQPVLPFYRSLVTPAELANTPGNLPSLPLLSSSVSVSVGETGNNTESVPKKKSRKSSMPIKIEKDELAEGSGSDEDESLPASTDAGMEYVVQTECDEHGIVPQTIQTQLSHTERNQSETKYNQNESCIMGCPSPFSGSQRDLCCPCDWDRVSQQPEDQTCREAGCGENELKKTPCKTEEDAEISKNDLRAVCADGGEDLQIVTCEDNEEDDLLHQCESCNKTFKNPYSVKMHYRSVHLKEMHMCTVAGCNAAFPSRRSRDRHSANLNLHHKLLTKDHYSTSGAAFTTSCRDLSSDTSSDLTHKETLSQASVIFKGSNRMGLVFPMSKAVENVEGPAKDVLEDETVLDLSTRGSSQSPSWDSDAGSEEGLPLEDSDESCDGLAAGQSASPAAQQLHSSSPITCHVCQKVYSNKGTFRAHYKTVHLRLLHKCKIPGCDTTFSSVRSRNRHSQNPNLHRNLPVLNQE